MRQNRNKGNLCSELLDPYTIPRFVEDVNQEGK